MNGMMAFGLETNAEGERARIRAGSPFLFFLCYSLRKYENTKKQQTEREAISSASTLDAILLKFLFSKNQIAASPCAAGLLAMTRLTGRCLNCHCERSEAIS
jgi:hypothetical protein